MMHRVRPGMSDMYEITNQAYEILKVLLSKYLTFKY